MRLPVWFLLTGVLTALWQPGLAQEAEKFEREQRMDPVEVPQTARTFVDSIHFQKRVKWYLEESLTGHSVEAKVRREGLLYSIEFDTLGRLEDIEVDIRKREIPANTLAAIEAALDQDFSRFRFKQIQTQWTGNRTVLLAKTRSPQEPEDVVLRYEIVVKGRDESGMHWYEYLFSDSGEPIQRSRIVFQNTDHLDY